MRARILDRTSVTADFIEKLSKCSKHLKKPSDILRALRIYAPWNCLEDDFWKDLFIRCLPHDMIPILMPFRLSYNIDQLAHMADILVERNIPVSEIRPFLTDRNSGINFLIDTGSKCSLVNLTTLERNNLSPIMKLTYLKDQQFGVYGIRNLTLNFGDNTYFQWNFMVADIIHPVIGADFLAHFDFTVDFKWLKLVRRQSTPILNDTTNVNKEGEELQQEILSRFVSSPDYCLLLADRISGLIFIVDSGASCSQIPPNPNENLNPLPFTRFSSANGSPVHEFGYRHLTVDLGIGTNFTWKFLVSDFGHALIGVDFLRYFCLKVDLKRGMLIKE